MEEHEELSDNVRANIAYHSALSASYNAEQPHFRPENVLRVTETLKDLISLSGNTSLVDLGCGTGFMLTIAQKLFQRVVGVDITPLMLNRVDCTQGNVELRLVDSSQTDLPSDSFNVCTAYGFLHHLKDFTPTLAEAYRLLKPGGIFYADQDPNYYFWDMIRKFPEGIQANQTLAREIESIKGKVNEIAAGYQLNDDLIELAEYHKFKTNGFMEEELLRILQKIGFKSIEFRYEWFLGQAYYIHVKPEEGVLIEQYLRDFLPATRNLFKYISFTAKK